MCTSRPCVFSDASQASCSVHALGAKNQKQTVGCRCSDSALCSTYIWPIPTVRQKQTRVRSHMPHATYYILHKCGTCHMEYYFVGLSVSCQYRVSSTHTNFIFFNLLSRSLAMTSSKLYVIVILSLCSNVVVISADLVSSVPTLTLPQHQRPSFTFGFVAKPNRMNAVPCCFPSTLPLSSRRGIVSRLKSGPIAALSTRSMPLWRVWQWRHKAVGHAPLRMLLFSA